MSKINALFFMFYVLAFAHCKGFLSLSAFHLHLKQRVCYCFISKKYILNLCINYSNDS